MKNKYLMKKIKKVFYIILIVLLLFVTYRRYLVMAEVRGCGYNPIKQVLTAEECVCYNIGSYVYFGYTCHDCKMLCEELKYGKESN